MQSRMQSDNETKDAIKEWIRKGAEDVHVSMIGKIESYDPNTNRASITPVGSFTAPDWQEIPYPTIHNVPIQYPCGNGGKSGCTFPVKSGDTCVIIFADHQIEDFLSGGQSDDMRNHSLNDAYAIPTLFSAPVPTLTTNPNDVCLFNDGSLCVLKPNSLTITLSDGTTAKFSGGDLKVNGISLVHHVHGGITRGGAKTNEPE